MKKRIDIKLCLISIRSAPLKIIVIMLIATIFTCLTGCTSDKYTCKYNKLIIAKSAADFDGVADGTTIVLQKDIDADDISINNLVNIDFNGYTLTCNSFKIKTNSAGIICLASGTIVTNDYKIDAPNAALKDNNNFEVIVISSSGVYINYKKYDTIQDAIDDAQNGDVIRVGTAIFNEALTIDNKEITIKGAGQGLTTINGPTAYNVNNLPKYTWKGWDIGGGDMQDKDIYSLVAVVNGANVTLEGVTIQGKTEEIGKNGNFYSTPTSAFVGIHVQDANVTLNRVDVQNIKPDNTHMSGLAHHNFAVFITSVDNGSYTFNYTNSTLKDLNRGGIYCWANNYSIKLNKVDVIGPGSGNIGDFTNTLGDSIDTRYAFAAVYIVSSDVTYENVTISNTWSVSNWGGAYWNWGGNCMINAPAGISFSNTGAR